MATPIPNPAASSPAAAPGPLASSLRPAPRDPFAQLLSMQMASNDPNSGGTDPLSALAGLGALEGGAPSANDHVLTYTLLQLLDRLLGASGLGAAATTSQPAGWPAVGPVSQEYHPGHPALDIAVPMRTPVQATLSGTVTYAGWNTEGYGNLVIVENGPYRAYYAHLDSLPVKVGDQVTARQVIGLSGNTGHSTGPHLHYEVRLNGTPIDPRSTLSQP